MTESLPERGIRLLTEEYERQRVLLTADHNDLVAVLEDNIAQYHFEDWQLGEVYERVLAVVQHNRGK